MLNTEIWKKIDDLPYEVSNFGTVRRDPKSKYNQKAKSCVQPYVNIKGYLCVNLYKNSKVYKFQVHRLIALYFIPNPNNYPCVNHIDGVTLNNSITNLEWCTHQQNMQHAWDTGLSNHRYVNCSLKHKNSTSKYKGVSWCKQRKRWYVGITVHKKRYGLGRFKDEIEAAKAYDKFVNENNLQQYGYSTNFS